tara:strand:- start:2374 stop:3486 length:1113 start_codon:yes stop_codon:yes gene_type:complete
LKIISKYVLHEFIRLVLLSIITLIVLFLIISFFENIDEFIIGKVSPSVVARFYLFTIPQIFFLMAPYSILLATVICISSLSRNSELTAMRAGGISLLSITTPILLVSLLVTLISIVSNEFITPFTNLKANYIQNVVVRKGKPRSIIQENRIWYHSKNDTLWNIEYLNPRTRTFKGVHIFFYKSKNSLAMRLDASTAVHDGTDWIFEDAYIRKFNDLNNPESSYFKSTKYRFSETPEDFFRIERKENEMSMRHIHQYRQKLRNEGLDSTRYDVDFHYKISYPFICVIMALIAIPFSLRSSRAGGIVFSCGLSIILGFIYYYLFSMFISIGHGGALPPPLSAWGLNIVALAFGFYMLLTIDSSVSFPFFQKG